MKASECKAKFLDVIDEVAAPHRRVIVMMLVNADAQLLACIDARV